ncbi:MAG: extracellular solute-binding protein, partial [Nonomuraea sp.]|nr:extracellular solute-binding protein [Nonomuraea sp.]
MDKAVELFNRTHRDVRVTLDNIPPGSRGGYGKIHAAVMSGAAPCLAQMEFQELPSFLLNSELVDLRPYLTQADRADFQQGAWELVTFEGGTYAVPQATGPMALYYREDLLKKWDIKVPTTWQEYRDAAARIRRADPRAYITAFPANDAAPFISLADGHALDGGQGRRLARPADQPGLGPGGEVLAGDDRRRPGEGRAAVHAELVQGSQLRRPGGGAGGAVGRGDHGGQRAGLVRQMARGAAAAVGARRKGVGRLRRLGHGPAARLRASP